MIHWHPITDTSPAADVTCIFSREHPNPSAIYRIGIRNLLGEESFTHYIPILEILEPLITPSTAKSLEQRLEAIEKHLDLHSGVPMT